MVNTTNNKCCLVSEIVVCVGDSKQKAYPGDLLPSFTEDCQTLSLFIYDSHSGDYIRVGMPESYLTRILLYMQLLWTNPKSDAHNFISFVAQSSLMKEKFFDPSLIQIGEVLGAFSGPDTIVGFAMYIGEGLYLSKMGVTGSLYATYVEEWELLVESNNYKILV